MCTDEQLQRRGLPEKCYGLDRYGDSILITRGSSSAIPIKDVHKRVNEVNSNNGVSRPQSEAMQGGLLFGWDSPASYPECYNSDGTINWEKARRLNAIPTTGGCKDDNN